MADKPDGKTGNDAKGKADEPVGEKLDDYLIIGQSQTS